MKKKYLIITAAVLFTILSSCYLPTNPAGLLSSKPYLQDFGGSIGKQYIVYTKEHLIYSINELTMSGGSAGIKLMSDINFSSGGEYEVRTKIDGISNLTGTFDGNGKTISGFEVDKSTTSYVGLIEEIAAGGAVKNLTISNAVIIGLGGVGAFAGWNNGGTIENCHNAADVMGTSSYIGGIVGLNGGGTAGIVRNCRNTGSVIGESANVGGVAGASDSGSAIENCYNTGSVTGTGDNVGGVVGYASAGTVKNSYNTGNVNGGGNVGGVVGDNSSAVENCYNIGIVSTTGGDIGGVLGLNSDVITACYFLKTASVNALLSGIGNPLSDVNASPFASFPFAIPSGWNTPIAVWEMATINGNQRPVLIGVGSGNER